jgi:hypothetical protein
MPLGWTEPAESGISWAAVIGGAFVAASISLIMLALGAGFGLSALSPWSNTGVSARELGVAAIVWLIVTQVLSCALGGYLAGRLRTKWIAIHTDEVYFRDTANGFLVWAVGVVMTAALLASAATSMVGKPPNASKPADPRGYFVDRLFWSDGQSQNIDAAAQTEAGLLLANALQQDDSRTDQNYLAHLVALHTGLGNSDADARVSQVLNDAREAEDAARRTTSRFLLWLFMALLMGAFSASFAATIGGRQRDHVRPS